MTKCKGLTKQGEKCRKCTAPDSDYCRLHKDQAKLAIEPEKNTSADCYVLIVHDDAEYHSGAKIWIRPSVLKLVEIMARHEWIGERPNKIYRAQYDKALEEIPGFEYDGKGQGILLVGTTLSALRKKAKELPVLEKAYLWGKEAHYCSRCRLLRLVEAGVKVCGQCGQKWDDKN